MQLDPNALDVSHLVPRGSIHEFGVLFQRYARVDLAQATEAYASKPRSRLMRYRPTRTRDHILAKRLDGGLESQMDWVLCNESK